MMQPYERWSNWRRGCEVSLHESRALDRLSESSVGRLSNKDVGSSNMTRIGSMLAHVTRPDSSPPIIEFMNSR